MTIGTEDVRLSATDVVGPEGAAPGDYVSIWVADTGKGMPADVVERVFEPFYTTKPLGHGTGLGLSQVYGFVRQSGGLVRIESTPGKGTTVRICLPQHEQVCLDEGPSAAPAPDDAEAGQAVLLVDDEDVATRGSGRTAARTGLPGVGGGRWTQCVAPVGQWRTGRHAGD